MTKSNQEVIVKNIEEATNLLHDALIRLKEENLDGQFDYCNSSKLANRFDELELLTKNMDKIIYQK